MPQVVVQEVGGQQIVVGETVVQQIVVGETVLQQIVVGGIGSKKLLGQKMGTLDEFLG
jgi:hypothetical protein